MRIVMIGSGNAATVLARRISEMQHEIVQVYNRTESRGKALAEAMGSSFTNDPQQITADADLYIVAFSDLALHELSGSLPRFKKLVVHTAGSVSMEVLQPVAMNYGVLYPLQSLHAASPSAPVIPFLVDASSPENLAFLYDFAKTLSTDVEVASDEERRAMHLAAVVVNNFTNHLYAQAEAFCEAKQINFRLLLPLIGETVGRLNYLPARTMQTGPAVRDDLRTIERHMHMLEKHPQLYKLYETHTESIRQFYRQQTSGNSGS